METSTDKTMEISIVHGDEVIAKDKVGGQELVKEKGNQIYLGTE